MFKSIFSILFAVIFGMTAMSAVAWAQTNPGKNAREGGVKECADEIEEVASIFFKQDGQDIPHISHDFTTPNKSEVDKRPFSSLSFRGYGDVGISHINIVASNTYLEGGGFFSRGSNRKCDVSVVETFSSPKTCEEVSGEYSQQGYNVSPFTKDITLLENDGSNPNQFFTHYYLTSNPKGDTCLVTRRRVVIQP